MAVHDETFWKKDFPGAIEGELAPSARRLRDEFVEEWLDDEDPTAAAGRIGFQDPYSVQYGAMFMKEPYVLMRMKVRQRELAASKEATSEDKELVLRALRLATKHGPYASRVAAAGRLATILGMDKGSRDDGPTGPLGGVMAVPAIADMTEWEKAAESSQDKLVAETQA